MPIHRIPVLRIPYFYAQIQLIKTGGKQNEKDEKDYDHPGSGNFMPVFSGYGAGKEDQCGYDDFSYL